MGSASGSPTSLMPGSVTTFDPESPTLALFLPGGGNLTITANALDDLQFTDINLAILFASQLGASLVMLITVLILTKPGKRLAPIFLLNSSSLLFNFLRLLMGCIYLGGPFDGFYVNLADDYSSVPSSAYAVSIAQTVFQILLTITVELSLALQVQVVCIELRRRYRRVIFGISLFVALIAIGFRLGYSVLNTELLLGTQNPIAIDWLEEADLNAQAVTIFFFSMVFVIKLGLALLQRHRLGLRRWGPMKILFTMGCQTLFIPAIFAILCYFDVGIPGLPSTVLTLVTLFLPLSALWASSAIEGPSRTESRFLAARGPLGAWSDGCSTLHNTNSSAAMSRKKCHSPTNATLLSLDAVLENPYNGIATSSAPRLERGHGETLGSLAPIGAVELEHSNAAKVKREGTFHELTG